MPPADGGPARRRAGRTAGRAASERFPRSLRAGRQGWCPAIPRQPRHGYAVGLPRGLLGRKGRDVRSRRAPCCCSAPRRALLTGPHPPGSSRLAAYGGSTTGSLVVTPSCLACRTRAVWQCRPVPSLSGLPHPAWRLPGRAALSFSRAAATAQRWVLSPHPGHTAPRGAPPCRRAAWPADGAAAQGGPVGP